MIDAAIKKRGTQVWSPFSFFTPRLVRLQYMIRLFPKDLVAMWWIYFDVTVKCRTFAVVWEGASLLPQSSAETAEQKPGSFCRWARFVQQMCCVSDRGGRCSSEVKHNLLFLSRLLCRAGLCAVDPTPNWSATDCTSRPPETIDSLVHFSCNPTPPPPHQSSPSPPFCISAAASTGVSQSSGSNWKILISILAWTIWLHCVLWLWGWELYCFSGHIWFLMDSMRSAAGREGGSEAGMEAEEKPPGPAGGGERRSDASKERV